MKYVAYMKQSKKNRRAQDLKRRKTWGNVCPVTRRAESKKAYCRARARQDVLHQSYAEQ